MSFFGDPNDSGERAYNTAERALRDLFVKNYLIDYCGVNAAIRCGFSSTVAPGFAQQFLGEPYVARKIVELGGDGRNETEVNVENQKRVLQGLFKEAHYRGPGSSHAARVNALKALAEITGLATARSAQGLGGGVMTVPEIADIGNWEKVASAQQEKLAQDARLH